MAVANIGFAESALGDLAGIQMGGLYTFRVLNLVLDFSNAGILSVSASSLLLSLGGVVTLTITNIAYLGMMRSSDCPDGYRRASLGALGFRSPIG